MWRAVWNRRLSISIAFTLLPATVVGSPPSTDVCEVRYEVLDLGGLNQSDSSARALNNRGHVTGNSAATAFLWSCADGMDNIGASIGLPDNVGTAMNERNQVIVYAAPQYPEMVPSVWLWERNEAPVLLDPQRAFFPESITNTGVATYVDKLWSKSTGLIDIDIGIPISSSHLNNLGRLSGIFYAETESRNRIYTWTRRDGFSDLGPAPEESVYSMDINDRGDLLINATSTAYIIDREGSSRALPLQPDVISVYAVALNLHREVIGSELTAETQPSGVRSRSFVWDSKHGYRNLDLLVDSPVGEQFEPVAINDWGWIAGNRRYRHGALAIPVPAHVRRFDSLNELRGPQLCRALNEVKLHRLLCAFRQ